MIRTRSPLLIAAALALGAAVSLGLARFAYALMLPPMRADLGWSYFTAGGMNTLNAAGYLAGALVPDTYRSGGRSLDDWLAAFGIECVVRHNAAADALATAELLLRLRALAAKQGTRGFAALVKAAKQQKWLGASDR